MLIPSLETVELQKLMTISWQLKLNCPHSNLLQNELFFSVWIGNVLCIVCFPDELARVASVLCAEVCVKCFVCRPVQRLQFISLFRLCALCKDCRGVSKEHSSVFCVNVQAAQCTVVFGGQFVLYVVFAV